MSQLQMLSTKYSKIFRTVPGLLSHVRNKTTSEHLLKLRGLEKGDGFKTAVQVSMEHKSHMNFRPIPEGSWDEYHRTRNTKWATMLMLSATFLGITTYIAYRMGCFYLHELPPRRKILPNSEKIGKIEL